MCDTVVVFTCITCRVTVDAEGHLSLYIKVKSRLDMQNILIVCALFICTCGCRLSLLHLFYTPYDVHHTPYDVFCS